MDTISVVCVNFNNTGYTRKLMESLRTQRGRTEEFTVECIIVDNSTCAEEAEECGKLAGCYSWITYSRPPKNLGYFGGLNYGLSISNAGDRQFVIIGNNDLQFDNEFCSDLHKREYDAKVFAVCPDIITADGLHQNPHILRRIGRFRRFQLDLYYSHYYMSRILLLILKIIRPVKSSRWQPPRACEIHMGVGACYILTAKFFKHFKKLNYPFFLYGEEAYISEQIHSEGGILWYDPGLRVHHAESASLSKLPSRATYEFERTGFPDFRKLM